MSSRNLMPARRRRIATLRCSNDTSQTSNEEKSLRKKRHNRLSLSRNFSVFVLVLYNLSSQNVQAQQQLRPQPPPIQPPPPPPRMVFAPEPLDPARPRPPASIDVGLPHLVTVTGSETLLRNADQVDQVIMPYENFTIKSPNLPDFIATNSYVIDHKRFVEPYATRCLSSTILEDPDAFEPTFIIIKPGSEIRINATASMETIRAAGFEPNKLTTISVHGFTQSYPATDWLRKLRALFEKNSHVNQQNLIIMDWGTASHGSYSVVAARVSGMGSFLANFLMKLIDMGADRMSIHLIGHSLGSHVVGFAGKRMRPRKLGRITALDPAGPCFGKFFSNSPTDRLSPDDAHEVDVYHYDDTFLGLPGQHGQWDVFVNGGSSQPGATDNVNAMFQALITMVFRRNRVLSESHKRSTEVATSQLAQSGCMQVAYECRDWPAFLAGECGQCDEQNSQCFFMGFSFQYENMGPLPLRQRVPGRPLFIATSPYELFCLQHYQILVQFEFSGQLAQQTKKQRWRVHLDLVNERGERANVTLTNQVAPNVFSYLFLSEQPAAKFTSALLQVRSSSDNSLIPMRQLDKGQNQAGAAQPPIRVNSIQVNFMSEIDPRRRYAFSSRLCPVGWVPSFVASRRPADASNMISIDSQEEWLGLDECDRRF